jgi:hypothetical protein
MEKPGFMKSGSIGEFLASRRATTILYVALFFAFSWLSYGAYVRFDLSSTGAMRISGTSKNLLRSLPEKAVIELFVSNDLPDEAVLVARKVRDFIQEYVNSSRGRVKLIVLDPINPPNRARKTCMCNSSTCGLAAPRRRRHRRSTSAWGYPTAPSQIRSAT